MFKSDNMLKISEMFTSFNPGDMLYNLEFSNDQTVIVLSRTYLLQDKSATKWEADSLAETLAGITPK